MKQKTLTKKFFLLIIINFIIIFFLSIFTIIVPLVTIAFGILTVALTFFLSSLTTFNYQKINKEVMMKRIAISKYKKSSLKTKMFLELFFYGFLFLIFWILYVYLFSLKGFGVNQSIPSQIIDWTRFSFLMYFYYGVAEVMMIIVFFYLVNHLVKNKNIIYIFIFASTLYLLIFSGLIYHYLGVKKINHEYFLTWKTDKYKTGVMINTFLFPWSSFDLFGKNLFYSSSFGTGAHNINWFDMSHMNIGNNTTYGIFFKTITWNPFIISFTPFVFLIFKNFIFNKKRL